MSCERCHSKETADAVAERIDKLYRHIDNLKIDLKDAESRESQLKATLGRLSEREGNAKIRLFL